MTDPAEIRAEGRRLREALWWTEPDSEEGRTATAAWSEWLEEHADVLLADPAPVGLTEKELRLVSDARELAPPNPDYPIPWDRYLLSRLIAIIDRLSAAPVGLTEAEVLHMTDLREAWRRAAPVYTDLAATDVEWLCTLIDRLSSPSVDPEEG